MTLRYLKIFMAVCETGSTTKAAELLHIAQPSISLALKEMEDYYGLKFFDRIAKRLYITESGRTLYRYAKQILTTFDEMEAQLKRNAAPSTLRIGSSMNIGSLLLPEYIKSFEKRCPNIKVHALIDSNAVIAEAVLNHEVDFALVESRLKKPGLCQIPYMKDALLFICGPTHPLYHIQSIEPADLEKYSFILRQSGSASRDIFNMEPLASLNLKIIMESSHNDAVINAVKAGLGLSVQPNLQIRTAIETGALHSIEVKGLSYSRDLHLIYKKGKTLDPFEKIFIEMNCHIEPEQLI